MSKVRLLVYRKKQSSDEFASTFELDLQEAPNISLNYKFSDVKEPEKRKASYSQTFKLPFTDNNNDFFENWFNVNLVPSNTASFNTKTRYDAVLYVGTVPQFEGVIQLRAVYQKAQYYEVILLSNAADLFTVIGTNLLRDVFKNDDGSYSAELNHTYNYNNLKYSWDGSSTSFQNSAGQSLRDADAGVQKVMYPMSVTVPKFYYGEAGTYLKLTQAEIDAFDPDTDLDDGVFPPMHYNVPITQFRPAIQLKTLLKLIFAKAGFSYTSTFIDGSYFGKLYMTTCNHTPNPCAVTVPTAGQQSAAMIVGNSTADWGVWSIPEWVEITECGTGDYYAADNFSSGWIDVPADTVTPTTGFTAPIDTFDLWNESQNTFTKVDDNQTALTVSFVYHWYNLAPINQTYAANYNCLAPDNVNFLLEIRLVSAETGEDLEYSYKWQNIWNANGNQAYSEAELGISLLWVPKNIPFKIQVRAKYLVKVTPNYEAYFKFGSKRCINFSDDAGTCEAQNFLYSGLYNQIKCEWSGYDSNIYGQTVNIPFCIDDKLTQKAFLKDILERFNLILIPDPDDQNNIIVETYTDYLSQGGIKNWTKKIDLEKEIIVKDTSSIQKRSIVMTDLEDEDLINKSIKEEQPTYNVYGNINIRDTQNQFATGEMKNTPVFSPYINEKIFVNNNEAIPTQLLNVAVQYEYTYKRVDTGFENELSTTKPKLFYYCGTPTPIIQAIATVDSGTSTGATIYMHQWTFSATETFGVWTSHAFTTYPLCSPYEITPNATTGVAELTNVTNSLYWNYNPPLAPELMVFNFNVATVSNINSLYYTYWTDYLNQIYNTEARIMECHINLDEVDIFNFNFNDEVFIKDSYWRVLNIHNYQVGGKASTKVTLLKSVEVYSGTCPECDYVVGNLNGYNMLGSSTFVWCPDTDPDCTPSLVSPAFTGLLVSEACCQCYGGGWTEVSSGLGICDASGGSPSIPIQDILSPRGFFSTAGFKTILSGKIEGKNYPLIVGTNTDKYSRPLLPYGGNDIVIKYNSTIKNLPHLDGESHRMILSGFTIGNTRGYAYPQGNKNAEPFVVPVDTSVVMRVKGISTVISGTNSTYPIGTTEAFAYYTAFKNKGGMNEQLGTAGGVSEFSIKESGGTAASTLYIAVVNGAISFGLNDSQTDTKRIWQLSVDMDINRVPNMNRGWRENFAQYQNYSIIQLQNLEELIWN